LVGRRPGRITPGRRAGARDVSHGRGAIKADAATVTAVTAFSDLSHHGDADLIPGLVDLAVNVRSGGTPPWLAARIRASDISSYPDQREAVAAIAARHRRGTGEMLLT